MIVEVFEAGLAEACGGEAGEFGASEGPGDLFVRLRLVAAAADDEEALFDEVADRFDGLATQGTGQGLEGVGLEDEVECGQRVSEEVGGEVVDGGVRESPAAPGYGGGGDVEGGDGEAAAGQVFSVVA